MLDAVGIQCLIGGGVQVTISHWRVKKVGIKWILSFLLMGSANELEELLQ